MLHSCLHRRIGLHRICPVTLGKVEIWEIGNKLGNIPASRVHFHRNRDRVAVIFNHEQNRQLHVRSAVDCFPEFALAGSAVAAGDVDDFVTMEDHVLIGGIIAAVTAVRSFWIAVEIPPRFRTSDCLE